MLEGTYGVTLEGMPLASTPSSYTTALDTITTPHSGVGTPDRTLRGQHG